MFDYAILETVITYISVAEASANSSWDEQDLMYLCERGMLNARRVGEVWYVRSDELPKLETPAVRAELRERIRSLQAETAQARRRARTHQGIHSLSRSLVGVLLLMLTGAATTIAWGLLEQRPIAWSGFLDEAVAEQRPAPAATTDRSLTGPALAATAAAGDAGSQLLSSLQNYLQAVPELIVLARDRVLLNWQNFLGMNPVEPSRPQPAPVAFPSLTASSTNELEQYIGQYISSEFQKLITQLRSGSAGPSSGPGAGVVVIPSIGSVQGDAAILQRIQSSFSDQVRIELDPSGTSGVITPLFGGASNERYLFLLTPVRR